jgi:hypothetical protein
VLSYVIQKPQEWGSPDPCCTVATERKKNMERNVCVRCVTVFHDSLLICFCECGAWILVGTFNPGKIQLPDQVSTLNDLLCGMDLFDWLVT